MNSIKFNKSRSTYPINSIQTDSSFKAGTYIFGNGKNPNLNESKKRIRKEDDNDPKLLKRSRFSIITVKVKKNPGQKTPHGSPLLPVRSNDNLVAKKPCVSVRRELFKELLNRESDFILQNNENGFNRGNVILQFQEVPSKKREAEVELKQCIGFKRPKLELSKTILEVGKQNEGIERDIQSIWLPNEIWEKVAEWLDLQDCGKLSFVCKEYMNLIYNYILPCTVWINRLKEVYAEKIIVGDCVQAEGILKLIDRTVKTIESDAFKDSLPTLSNIQSNAAQLLRQEITDYNDSEDFLLKLFLGNQKLIILTYAERSEYLEFAHRLCSNNNGVEFCRGKKIIEYFIRWEDTVSLRKRAIVVFFSGLKNVLLSGNEKSVNQWIELLESSFDDMEQSIERNTWFYKNIDLLKTPFNSVCAERAKKKILFFIEQNLYVYLQEGKKFVLRELENLKHVKGLSIDLKREVIRLLMRMETE